MRAMLQRCESEEKKGVVRDKEARGTRGVEVVRVRGRGKGVSGYGTLRILQQLRIHHDT